MIQHKNWPHFKQYDHDMSSYVSKVQYAVKELKMFVEADTLEGTKTTLDNMYIVLVLRGIHPIFEHVCNQILTSQ